MNSPTAAAATPAPTTVPQDTATLLFEDAPTTYGTGRRFDDVTAFDRDPAPAPVDDLGRSLRQRTGGAPPDTSQLDRATRLGSLPSSQVARLVIQAKAREYGLPQDYVDTALRAQDLAVSIEQDMERMGEGLAIQMVTPDGGGAFEILQILQLIDQRASQLVRLQEHLRDNFQLARRDPVLARAQLEAWIGPVAR